MPNPTIHKNRSKKIKYKLTSGVSNVAIGSGALKNITGKGGNVSIGFNGFSTASGDFNFLLGYTTGQDLQGDYKTII